MFRVWLASSKSRSIGQIVTGRSMVTPWIRNFVNISDFTVPTIMEFEAMLEDGEAPGLLTWWKDNVGKVDLGTLNNGHFDALYRACEQTDGVGLAQAVPHVLEPFINQLHQPGNAETRHPAMVAGTSDHCFSDPTETQQQVLQDAFNHYLWFCNSRNKVNISIDTLNRMETLGIKVNDDMQGILADTFTFHPRARPTRLDGR
eukprot:Clim_evm7s84 gene=Clim_evmTU7s84